MLFIIAGIFFLLLLVKFVFLFYESDKKDLSDAQIVKGRNLLYLYSTLTSIFFIWAIADFVLSH